MIGFALRLYSWRQAVASGIFFSGVLLLLASIASPLLASREVLSDMDCVVEPSAVIELGSAVPGLLSDTFFDRSDYVSAGTIMARLESSVELATLAIALETAKHRTAIELRKTTAEFGARTHKRNEMLLKTAAVSQQSMDQLDTETRIARLQVRQEKENHVLSTLEVRRAQAALDRRQIVSPIDGTVVQRLKTSGEYVDREAIYQVAQLNPLNIEVIVPVEYLGQIESGMRGGVLLYAPGFENRVLEAQVRRIDAVSDAASGTYGVRLVLDNPDFTIPSGVRCQVDFFTS